MTQQTTRTTSNLRNKGFTDEEQIMISEARKRKSENALAVYVDIKYKEWLKRRGFTDNSEFKKSIE